MAKLYTKKSGNRPEGFEPSAFHIGSLRHGSAACIRVLGGTYIKYSSCSELSQGGF